MDPFMATIQLFAFSFAPKGWMACDGSLLPISHYPALFSLVGNTYGGDGRVNFGLPDLKGKEPVAGAQYCICIEGVYPSRP